MHVTNAAIQMRTVRNGEIATRVEMATTRRRICTTSNLLVNFRWIGMGRSSKGRKGCEEPHPDPGRSPEASEASELATSVMHEALNAYEAIAIWAHSNLYA